MIYYSIESFEDSEGGMVYECYRDSIPTLEDAIRILKEMMEEDPIRWRYGSWYITVQVEDLT